MRTYSPFFSTLYDQKEPVGNLGRGTHYSICRYVHLGQLPRFHDFAVIWDEDHDDRVVWVIEQMMVNGLFRPVQVIGERKGTVTVLTRPFRYDDPQDPTFDGYSSKVKEIAAKVPGDSFACSVEPFPGPSGIISAEGYRVMAFLVGLDALWLLQEKPLAFHQRTVCLVGRPATACDNEDASDPFVG